MTQLSSDVSGFSIADLDFDVVPGGCSDAVVGPVCVVVVVAIIADAIANNFNPW